MDGALLRSNPLRLFPIFISHHFTGHLLLLWLQDIDGGMQSNIYDSMAQGVSKAAVVIAFIDQRYQVRLQWLIAFIDQRYQPHSD